MKLPSVTHVEFLTKLPSVTHVEKKYMSKFFIFFKGCLNIIAHS